MITQQLVDYIRSQLLQGTNTEVIRNTLLQNGWQSQDIAQAFSIIQAPNTESLAQSTTQESQSNMLETIHNGKATWSLIFGIIGLIAWFIPLIGAPITIIGLILGIKGIKSLKRKRAIIGIVLSIIGLVATIINASIGAYQGATGSHPIFNHQFTNQQQIQRSTVKPSPSESINQEELESQPYISSKFGFKIRPPKEWQVDENGRLATLVLFSNPTPDQEGTNSFSANINITSEDAQGLTLENYVNTSKESLSKLLQNYQSVEDSKVTVSGREAYIIGGTFTQGVYKIRNKQLIVIYSDKAYIVTASTLESSWNKYKDIFEASLLTFEL